MAPAKGAGESPGAGTWAWAAHKQNTAQRERAATVARRRETDKSCKRGTRRLGRVSLRVPVTTLFQRSSTLTSNDDRDHLAGAGVHPNFVFGTVCYQHIHRPVWRNCRSSRAQSVTACHLQPPATRFAQLE